MSPADLGVVTLADAIASRTITAEAAVQAALERAAQAANLNAVVALEPEAALEQARLCDAETAAGRSRGPLHGVPMAHKDMFHRAGRPSDYGSLIRRGFVPADSSPLVARLEAAGAITIGRLHMAEFALGPTGHNAHLGRCRNPWHPDAITGGSSSGSGAAVAARIVPAALGSDTGGSVRLPAAFCGVAGLKPTHDLLSRHGMMPLSSSMDTAGPLARSTRDLARLMWVLTAGLHPYEQALDGRLDGIVIGVPTRYYTEDLAPEVAEALAEARDVLTVCGATVIDVAVPDTAPYSGIAARIWAPEAAAVHLDWLDERPGDYGEQVRNRLEQGRTVTGAHHVRALGARAEARAEMLAGPLATCDLLLTPAARMTVPMADAVDARGGPEMDRMIGEISALTRTISMLGFPALVTPMGVDGRGLPIGLQLVGAPCAEALLMRAGDAFERATRWIDRRPLFPRTQEIASWTSVSSSRSVTMAG